MKTTSMPLMLALLTGAIATAQEPSGQRRPPPVPPLLALFDADHDGVLAAEEIKNAPAALGKLDRNGDGKITPDEIRPLPAEGERPAPGDAPQGPPPQGRAPLPPVIAALDTDKNGTVSAAELGNSTQSLKQLDRNADGELSLQELLPIGPPPPRGGQQGGGDRPQGPPPPDGPDEPLDGE